MSEIVRFGEHVICSDPNRTNRFLGEKLLRDGTTMESLSENVIKTVYVSEDLDSTDDPGKCDGTYKWALVKLKKKYKGGNLYFMAEFDRVTAMYDGYLVGDIDHVIGPVEKKATYRGASFYAKYNSLKAELETNPTEENNKTGTSRLATKSLRSEKISLPSVSTDRKDALTVAKEICDAMVSDIFENLLINNWCSKTGLERFIKIIGTRLKEIRDNKYPGYFVESSTRYAIVNTGLINRYKQDVYIIYRYNATYDTYQSYKEVRGKGDWLDAGFTMDQICTLKPIRFFELSESLGSISANNIDISTDTYRHIIEENKERLTDVIGERDYSVELIADRIRTAVSTCLMMLERDPAYAKPYYTVKTGLSWMLPLHIRSGLSEAPEFGLILSKQEAGYYAVKTAIPYDDEVKDYLTASSLYGKNW